MQPEPIMAICQPKNCSPKKNVSPKKNLRPFSDVKGFFDVFFEVLEAFHLSLFSKPWNQRNPTKESSKIIQPIDQKKSIDVCFPVFNSVCVVFFGDQFTKVKIQIVICWVVPPPSNSHHQDYYIFSRDPYKPSLATVTGTGDNPSDLDVFLQ